MILCDIALTLSIIITLNYINKTLILALYSCIHIRKCIHDENVYQHKMCIRMMKVKKDAQKILFLLLNSLFL